MSQTRSIRRLAVAGLLGVALVAAGCGNDDTDTASDDATTTTVADGMGSSMEPFGPACDSVPTTGKGSFAGMAEDPAATAASNNPALSTLVTAVGAADLVDTLNGDGPFTIFAPTNDAFAKIPSADLDAVLADKEQLSRILTYHVVAGKMTAADLASAGSVKTVEGGELKISGSATEPMVGDAAVVCGDVQVGNGIVHIIDTVLMPPADDAMGGGATGASMPTGPGCAAVPADGDGSFAGMADDPAATAASNNPLLSTLVSAVQAAGLVDTLNGEGPFTIFAPTNDAFAKIPAADLEKVLADKEQLTKILTYHVVPGKMTAADLAKAGTATTVEGGDLTVTAEGESAKVNDATVVCADVPVANGVVHIIDTVLMPGM